MIWPKSLYSCPSFLIWFYRASLLSYQKYVLCFAGEQSALGSNRFDQSFFPKQEAHCPGKPTLGSVLSIFPWIPPTPRAHDLLAKQYILTLSRDPYVKPKTAQSFHLVLVLRPDYWHGTKCFVALGLESNRTGFKSKLCSFQWPPSLYLT